MLLSTNTGWVLDPEHNATSNPEDQTYLAQNRGVYFLFFKNNNGVSPCEKLMIGYAVNGYYPGVPYGYPYNQYGACGTTVGLFCSMIPAGSNKSFGNDPTSSIDFLTNEATKIHGAYNFNGTNNSYSVAYRNQGSTTYHAQVVTDGKTVVFRINMENNMGSMFFVGPVIETLAHPSMDTACTAKMMSKVITYNSYSEGADYQPGSTYYDFWRAIDTGYNTYSLTGIFDAEGNPLHSSNGHGLFFTSDSQLLSGLVSNSSIAGFNRWTAISCGVMSPDPTTHYIVQGDGLKGYLDTNFLRCVRDNIYTIGQTFDDGNFVYIGSSLAMGWDPSNEAFNG